MKFQTASGSTYEVDMEKKQIRRLNGKLDPRPRQGKDGEWKSYASIVNLQVGSAAVIFWNPETTPLLEGSPKEAFPSTVTSKVVSIEDICPAQMN